MALTLRVAKWLVGSLGRMCDDAAVSSPQALVLVQSTTPLFSNFPDSKNLCSKSHCLTQKKTSFSRKS